MDEDKLLKKDVKEKAHELSEAIKTSKFYGGNYGASYPKTFEEWDAVQEVRRVSSKIWNIGDAFNDMYIDILYDSHEDGIPGMMKQLISLVDSMGDKIKSMQEELELIGKSIPEQEPEEQPEPTGLEVVKNLLIEVLNRGTKEPEPESPLVTAVEKEVLSDNLTLLKGSDGVIYLYGRPTNNVYDREGEVLTEESHKEFMQYLDANPNEAPELWAWHVKGTAFKNRAVWWDYADGFVHMLWPLEGYEAQTISDTFKEYDPGMSHGFYPLEKDGDAYIKYRMAEASLLPLNQAANLYATFEILGEVEKMFSPEKRDFIAKISSPEVLETLELRSTTAKERIDDSGLKRKEVEDQAEDHTVEGDEEPMTELAKQIGSMESTVSKGFENVLGIVEGLNARLKAVEDQLSEPDTEEEEEPEPEPAMTGKSMAAVVEAISMFNGSVLDPATRNDKSDDTTPKEITDSLGAPKETAHDVASGHLLQGIMPKIAAQ